MGQIISVDKNICDDIVSKEIEKLINSSEATTTYSIDLLDEYCKVSATDIRSMMQETSDFSIVNVVRMFHYKQQLINNSNFALTDIFYARSLSQARNFQKNLDAGRSVTLEKYPLLGFIISIQESIGYAGSLCTFGSVKNLTNRPSSAGIINYLESKGALITCKGNVAQGLLSLEANNFIYGNVSHPKTPARSAGGSSGGIAATVATCVVNAAIGCDTSGCLRSPALFCGLFAFKPTAGRFSSVASDITSDSQSLIKDSCGPIARSAKDLELLVRVMSDYNCVSFEAPPMEWKAVVSPKRVGIISEFSSLLGVCGATDRALAEAIQCGGYEIVVLDLNDIIDDLVVNSLACYMKDKKLLNIVSGSEPLIDAYDGLRSLFALPLSFLRMMKNSSLFLHSRDKIYVRAYLKSIELSCDALLITQSKLRQEVIQRFTDAGVEVCLTYGLFPAIRKNTAKHCDLMRVYCYIWNYLNFPVGVVPITTVREDEQHYESQYTDRLTEELVATMHGSAGLPVGVQVVGLPWHDELVVDTMVSLEEKLIAHGHSFFVLN